MTSASPRTTSISTTTSPEIADRSSSSQPGSPKVRLNFVTLKKPNSTRIATTLKPPFNTTRSDPMQFIPARTSSKRLTRGSSTRKRFITPTTQPKQDAKSLPTSPEIADRRCNFIRVRTAPTSRCQIADRRRCHFCSNSFGSRSPKQHDNPSASRQTQARRSPSKRFVTLVTVTLRRLTMPRSSSTPNDTIFTLVTGNSTPLDDSS